MPLGRQEGLHRHRIGHFPDADEISGDLIDAPVQGLKKMGRFQKVRNPVECIIVDENSAEKRLFCLNIVGRLPIAHVLLVPRIVEFAYRRFRHDSLFRS